MKKDLIKRLITYAKMDTQSNEESDTTPSTPGQMELAKKLVDEDHFRLDKLLNNTEQDLQRLDKEKKDLQRILKENEKLKRVCTRKLSQKY